jgi:hypothetical protein
MIPTLRRFALTLVLAAAVAVPAQAQDTDISGQWEFTSEGRRGGPQTTVFTFVQDGMTVTGSAAMAMGGRQGGGGRAPRTFEIQDGKLDGNTFTFTLVLGMGERTIELSYMATVDGDTMTGTTTNQRRETPFTAKRKEG